MYLDAAGRHKESPRPRLRAGHQNQAFPQHVKRPIDLGATVRRTIHDDVQLHESSIALFNVPHCTEH